MSQLPDFMAAYPLTAKAAIHTPLVFRAGLFADESLPWPSLEGLRDFARFAGIADGAVRTALSRARREGSIIVQNDEDGGHRYSVSPATFARGAAQIRADQRPEGFLLAVFSFKTAEEEERSSLRALLKSYGFRRLAQNTFIHGRIDTTGLTAAIRDLGLEKNFFLFTCPDIDDEGLISRILPLFDLEARRAELAAYLERLTGFLGDARLADSRDEFARRILYVAAVHWEQVEAGEPPIPRRHLPADYPFGAIQAFYGQKIQEGRSAMLEYFRKTFA